MNDIERNINLISKTKFHKNVDELNPVELHEAVSSSIMSEIADNWKKSKDNHLKNRCAYYFSAEFLVGRAIYNNLMCLGLTEKLEEILSKYGKSLSELEEIEDAALGNGGLGRLAACFLDSAATLDLPLDGYGIRYKYGLFKQYFKDGFQKEAVDDWTKFGDPWSIRVDDEAVEIEYTNFNVLAVPYDMPIIGYKTNNISTLRLWQAEPIVPFDFDLFNNQKYDKSVEIKSRTEDISRVLYPNDTTFKGKLLRLKQQYFFSSASLKDIIRNYKKKHGKDFSYFAKENTIQLNDTHPVISIPELIRLLGKEGIRFDEALSIASEVFNYTNHTIMQEALEKWDKRIIIRVNRELVPIIKKITAMQLASIKKAGIKEGNYDQMLIIQGTTIHMAYLACYVCKYINGVAKIHTEILKDDTLKCWYKISPKKFQNKTNGITQRRWIKLCNPVLSNLITELLGTDEWVNDLNLLKKLEKYSDDNKILDKFISIKNDNKCKLSEYIYSHEGIIVDPNTSFDVQIKRLHEYKRQLLNVLTIIELYFEIKEGTIKDFMPTTFIFGAKSAPGYFRAKAIIKLANEVARVIDKDPVVSQYIKVVFVSNYNVSYAEKLVAAADVSEQISTAGTEASGTGNMKLMLNGAVTIGTYDGANIEIVDYAGKENNYIFGAKVEDINAIKNNYVPKDIYKKDLQIKRTLDTLIDGTFSDGGTGMFKELYSAILDGASWHKPDHYFLLLDFKNYLNARIQLNSDQKDKYSFAKKCWLNMCNAGFFSSDRTIRDYADNIWHIDKSI